MYTKTVRREARSDVIRAIEDLCMEKMSMRVDSPDTDLFAAGLLDSMTLAQMILHLETRFGVTLPMQELNIESFRSLGTIAELLSERKSAEPDAATWTGNGITADA